MNRLFILLIMLSVIVSCAKTLDGSSEENYKSSLEALKSDLSEEETKLFEEALMKVVMEDMQMSDLMKEGGVDDKFNTLMQKVDGMSYDDVISEGERIQKVIDERNKEQAKLEIEELYSKKYSSKKDSIELSKFKVEKSRFYKRKDYIGYEPVIDLTVFNGTQHPVSRAHFTGTIKSPERTIPWLVEDFNYVISGGLEPGERANWVLGPNKYSEWGTVKAPKDAIFTVVVTKLDGADGEKLFSIDFNEEDEDRLKELLKNYPEFKQD